MENIEFWKDIKGYEGIYQISNLGRVKRLPNITKNGNGEFISKENFLIPYIDDLGYYRVSLTLNYISKKFRVHRLLAIHFIPNPENKPQVNHINGIKSDNRLENLEWVTNKENIIHAFKNGLSIPKKGEKCGRSKLKESQVLEIKERLKKGENSVSIAKSYVVTNRTILHIKNKESWTHLD